jgi:hypothetical protein
MHPDPYHLARTNLGCPTLYGWVDWFHDAPQPLQPTITYLWCTSVSTTIWKDILLPSPTYQQSYHVVPPHSLGGPPLIPQMHLVPQSSVGPPPTPTCDHKICGGTSTSYMPYGSSPQKIHTFHFLVLHSRFLLHKDNHMSAVNFVQPSPIQQLHTFE